MSELFTKRSNEQEREIDNKAILLKKSKMLEGTNRGRVGNRESNLRESNLVENIKETTEEKILRLSAEQFGKLFSNLNNNNIHYQDGNKFINIMTTTEGSVTSDRPFTPQESYRQYEVSSIIIQKIDMETGKFTWYELGIDYDSNFGLRTKGENDKSYSIITNLNLDQIKQSIKAVTDRVNDTKGKIKEEKDNDFKERQQYAINETQNADQELEEGLKNIA